MTQMSKVTAVHGDGREDGVLLGCTSHGPVCCCLCYFPFLMLRGEPGPVSPRPEQQRSHPAGACQDFQPCRSAVGPQIKAGSS